MLPHDNEPSGRSDAALKHNPRGAGAYVTREADRRRDRESILDLWRRNLPEATAGRYAWLYDKGPAAGLLLEADGRIAGSVGLMRRTFRVFGQTQPAGQMIDLNVDRNYRTVGPAIRLGRAVTAAVTRGELAMIYGFPNRQSEDVLRCLGYRALGNLGRWVRPISCRAVLRRHGWPGPLCNAVARLADPLLWLRSLATFSRRPREVAVETADEFDDRFDRLWEKVALRLPIVAERTAHYLHWRFSQCRNTVHRVLCLTDARGELLAYLVYNRRGDTVYVGDFLSAEAAHFDLLLAEFLRLVRRQGAEAVVAVYLGGSQICNSLARLGFWPRPSHWKAMVYADPQRLGELGEGLLDLKNWYFTRADIDTDE